MPEGYRLDVSGMNRLVDRLAEAEDKDLADGVFNAFEWIATGGTAE